MNRLGTLDWIAMILMIVGAINWGLVGALNFNLVTALFGTMPTLVMVIYILVGLSGVYALFLSPKLTKK